jgi:8-oxo-dGTP diphosphatase
MSNSPKSEDFPDCFYRVSIKGLCVRDGKVLLMREGESLGGQWELPGGGLDFGEDIRKGFMREVQEETGLKVTKMSDEPVYIWSTRIDKWRGMEWYYTLILAYRIELENLEFTPSEECLELRFFSQDELRALRLKERNPQTESFKAVFDPKDFPESF